MGNFRQWKSDGWNYSDDRGDHLRGFGGRINANGGSFSLVCIHAMPTSSVAAPRQHDDCSRRQTDGRQSSTSQIHES